MHQRFLLFDTTLGFVPQTIVTCALCEGRCENGDQVSKGGEIFHKACATVDDAATASEEEQSDGDELKNTSEEELQVPFRDTSR